MRLFQYIALILFKLTIQSTAFFQFSLVKIANTKFANHLVAEICCNQTGFPGLSVSRFPADKASDTERVNAVAVGKLLMFLLEGISITLRSGNCTAPVLEHRLSL